eukprot:206115-Rhodomonas_salina.2
MHDNAQGLHAGNYCLGQCSPIRCVFPGPTVFTSSLAGCKHKNNQQSCPKPDTAVPILSVDLSWSVQPASGVRIGGWMMVWGSHSATLLRRFVTGTATVQIVSKYKTIVTVCLQFERLPVQLPFKLTDSQSPNKRSAKGAVLTGYV